MRIAVRYARGGPAAYISHLDMQRAFGRAVRRARIPALYSKGFNPHLVMSFASPLSVGYETKADYLELAVEEGTDLQQVLRALRGAAPPGIDITGVYLIPEGTRKLMALNSSADYAVRFPTASDDELHALAVTADRLSSEETHIVRNRKGRELDLKELLRQLSPEGDTVFMRTANASSASLNPGTVAEELLALSDLNLPCEICRLECYGEKDGKEIPFSEFFVRKAEIPPLGISKVASPRTE